MALHKVGVEKTEDGDQFVHVYSVAGWNEDLAHALAQNLDACGGSLGVDWTRHVRVDPTLSPSGPSKKMLAGLLA
jgi:hypothetical protein